MTTATLSIRLLLSALICLLAPAICLAERNEVLDTVIAAWKKRAAEIQSLRCEFVTSDYSPRAKQFPGSRPTRGEILIQGSRIAISEQGPSFFPQQKKFMQGKLTRTYDEKSNMMLSMELSDDGKVNREKPSGYVRSGEKNFVGESNSCIALRLWCRPLHKGIGRFDPDRLQLISGTTIVQGVPCVGVEQINEQSKLQCWLDPKRDYIPIRYSVVVNASATIQCELNYGQDTVFSWVPDGWTFVLFNPDLSEDTRTKVTRVELNGPIATDSFRIVFPVDTDVEDAVDNSRYVIMPDGSKKIISQAPKAESTSSWVTLTILWTLAVIACFGTFLMVRRLRKTHG